MADKKISALTSLTSVDVASDTLPIVDSNASETKKVTPQDLTPTVRVAEQSSTSTPASGYGLFYAKTDGKPYFKNDGGTETDLSATSNPSSDQNFQGNYIVNEQGRQNHVANTMSSPYYRFDGSNDQIDISDNANLDLVDALSIECLFKTETNLSVYQELVNKADAGQSYSAPYRLLITDGGLLNAYVANGSALNTPVASSQLTTGQWYHVVFTADGSNLKLYLNGTLIDTESQTITPETQNGILSLGGWGTSGGEYNHFHGEMQRVRLFNKALTATEVKEMYSGASVPFKYKGANQTNLLTGGDVDFESTAGGWVNSNIGGTYNESGDLTATATSSGQFFANNVLTKTVGKRYRLTFDVSSLTSTWTIQEHDDSDSAGSVGTVSANGAQSFEFTSKFATGFRFVAGANDSSANFDNFSVVPIGAVAEYDGSGAGEKIWGDKSGNDLHGTVSGATLENTPYNDRTEYETGLFTPVLSDGSNNATNHSSTKGIYTKTGNCVSFNIWLRITSKGSIGDTTGLRITGLPYVNGDGFHFYSGINVGYGVNLLLGNATETITGYVEYANSYITLQNWDATGGTNPLTGSDISGTAQLMVRGQYWVSD